MVPFGQSQEYLGTFTFWIGLLFVTFPLNYLVYGLNDCNDVAADRVNERKGNYLFGAKAGREQLKSVPKRIFFTILPFFLLFSVTKGLWMFALLCLMVIVNIGYNFPPLRLKEKPPFEILIQSGYVITALFCVDLNQLKPLPWQTLVYLVLFAFQAHIAGEIMDIEPDRKALKRTTATILGRKKSKILMLSLLLLESYLLWHWFGDWVLGGFLAIFSFWLILDIFFIFKNRPYTTYQMKLFGYAMNASAILSMMWVLYSGKLLLVV